MTVIAGIAGTGLPAQRPSTRAEVAARLTGAWKLNLELSPNLDSPGQRGRGMRGGVQPVAMLQRGGRGGGTGGGPTGGSDGPVPAEELAAQAALSILHQVPLELSIAATESQIAFQDPRGHWNFTIDDKTTTMEVPGGRLKVKTKWDRLNVRQEFSSTQRKLIKTWSIDDNGRLVLTERIESLTFNSTGSKAVFDRQQSSSVNQSASVR